MMYFYSGFQLISPGLAETEFADNMVGVEARKQMYADNEVNVLTLSSYCIFKLL